nr:hypothetical protein [uncultured Chryseobacterium sp.]
MIRRLKYNEIDFEKYAKCLENSEQRNWYAKKEVLDQLSGNWELLVNNDYEAVMPLHITRKLGVKFVHMPLFCQQLGIFSRKDDSELNTAFLLFLKKRYKIFMYSFNDTNKFTCELETRKNYLIPISDYEVLRRKKYFKGRKSTVKCSQHLTYREIELDTTATSFIRQNFKGLYKDADFEKFENYVRFLKLKDSLKIVAACKGETFVNIAVLTKEPRQYSLLALINDEQQKAENGASFLIDKILEKYISENTFNFMGSNIRGIEVFFKSFGSELHDYCFIENKLLKRFS